MDNGATSFLLDEVADRYLSRTNRMRHVDIHGSIPVSIRRIGRWLCAWWDPEIRELLDD